MKAYQADIAKFETNDTQIFGLSVDSVPANRKFAELNGITFPLLSDSKELWSKTTASSMKTAGTEIGPRL